MKKFLKQLKKSYLFVAATALLLVAFTMDGHSNAPAVFDLVGLVAFAVLIIAILIPFIALLAMFLSALVIVPAALITAPKINTKEQRRQALQNFISKAGGRDIYIKRVGTVGSYLEHYLVHYYDAENSWQVRHIIRNQKKDRFYWDDPVVRYEREISAEISQSKQELINDLDLEIHQLRQAIATHANPEK